MIGLELETCTSKVQSQKERQIERSILKKAI